MDYWRQVLLSPAVNSIRVESGWIPAISQFRRTAAGFSSSAIFTIGMARTASPGIRSAVSCYASTNLYDWTREGVALWQTNEPSYLKVNIPNDCNMKV